MKKAVIITTLITQLVIVAFSQQKLLNNHCIIINTSNELYYYSKPNDTVAVKVFIKNKCDIPFAFHYDKTKQVLPNVSCGGKISCGFSFNLYNTNGECILPELDNIDPLKFEHRDKNEILFLKPDTTGLKNEFIIPLFLSNLYPNLNKKEAYLLRINYKYCFDNPKSFHNDSINIEPIINWQKSSEFVKLIVK